MHKKKIFLLTIFVILLMGIVNANDVSDDNNDDSAIDLVDMDHTSNNNHVVNERNIRQQAEINENKYYVDKKVENKTITKKYDAVKKESVNTVYVSNYTQLATQIERINKASEKTYTINLKPGNYNATTNIILESDTEYTKKITINANNIILDGKNKYQFLSIQQKSSEENEIELNNINLKINNIILKNFKGYFGGAIHKANEGMLTINNSKFINNKAIHGGAISNSGNLTIINSEFISNFANTPSDYGSTFGGGAIANDGFSDGRLIIVNSKFISNRAMQSAGAISNSGSLTVINTEFKNNKVLKTGDREFRGGAIHNDYTYDHTVSIIKSKFSNNVAEFGSAIYNSQSNMSIKDSEFINNSVVNHGYSGIETYMTINNSKFINSSDYYNGVVIDNTANLTITNSKIMNNKGRFGPISNEDNANLTIMHSEFKKNSNVWTSGGVIHNRYSNLTIINSQFSNNSAHDGGGAIINLEANMTIKNSIFTDNTACSGGAISNEYSNLNIINSKFIKNEVTEGDYQISYSGGAIYNYNASLTINYSEFTNNKALRGQSIYNEGKLTLKNSVLKNNSITGTGKRNIINTKINNQLVNPRKESTTLTVDSKSSVYVGNQISIYGKLSTNGIEMPYKKVVIQVDGKEYNLTTTKFGNYVLKIIPSTVGKKTVTVKFAGTDMYKSTNATATFKSIKNPTLLTLGSSKVVHVGDKVCIYGKLTYNGKALANKSIIVKVNRDYYNVRTTKYGNYKLYATVSTLGKNNVAVRYSGSKLYPGDINKTSFMVSKKPALLSLISSKEVYVGDKVCIYGKLTSNGKPLANKSIIVKVNRDYYNVQTTKYGNYKFYANVTLVGQNNITAKYLGSNVYQNVLNKTIFEVINK